MAKKSCATPDCQEMKKTEKTGRMYLRISKDEPVDCF